MADRSGKRKKKTKTVVVEESYSSSGSEDASSAPEVVVVKKKSKGKGKGKGKGKRKDKTPKASSGSEDQADGSGKGKKSGKRKGKKKSRKSQIAKRLKENRALMDKLLNIPDLTDEDLFLQERIRRANTLFETFIEREQTKLSLEWLSQVKRQLQASDEVIQGSLAAYFFDMPAEQYQKAHFALDEIILRMAITAFSRLDDAVGGGADGDNVDDDGSS